MKIIYCVLLACWNDGPLAFFIDKDLADEFAIKHHGYSVKCYIANSIEEADSSDYYADGI